MLIEKFNSIQKLLQKEINDNKLNSSLFVGSCGEILLISKDKGYDLTDDLNKLFDEINSTNTCTFCSGLAGLGWFIQYLSEEGIVNKKDVIELLFQIDDITYNSALKFIDENNHDFLHGAVGIAVYLTGRVKENKLVEGYLLKILQALKKISNKNSEGISWGESTFYRKEKEDELYKEMVNLSLSHGLAGKIVLFSKVYKNIKNTLTKELLEESVKFMLNNKNPNGCISMFPSKIGLGDTTYSRLSWCYGDLGISIALWQAGEVLENKKIKKEAVDICLQTTKRRTLENTSIFDAGLCHGTAGVAHIYSRMFRYTGLSEFKKAANYWMQETLNMATHKDGLVGFMKWNSVREEWEKDTSFIEGVAGIGLVLSSHIMNDEPTWDSCLLLS